MGTMVDVVPVVDDVVTVTTTTMITAAIAVNVVIVAGTIWDDNDNDGCDGQRGTTVARNDGMWRVDFVPPK